MNKNETLSVPFFWILNNHIDIKIDIKIIKVVLLKVGFINLIPSVADKILIAGVNIPSLTTAENPNNPKK